MADVYKAADLEENSRIVAVKILSKKSSKIGFSRLPSSAR